MYALIISTSLLSISFNSLTIMMRSERAKKIHFMSTTTHKVNFGKSEKKEKEDILCQKLKIYKKKTSSKNLK